MVMVAVTGQHIQAGVPCYPRQCPVAWALRAAGYDLAQVYDYVSVLEEGRRVRHAPSLARWIARFDKGDSDRISPIMLVLDEDQGVIGIATSEEEE